MKHLYCIVNFVNFIRPSTFNIIINYNENISNGHNREMKATYRDRFVMIPLLGQIGQVINHYT